DEIVFINVRPVISLASIYGQQVVDFSDQMIQKFAAPNTIGPVSLANSPPSSPKLVEPNIPSPLLEQAAQPLNESETIQDTEHHESTVTFSDDVTDSERENKRASRRGSKIPEDDITKLEQKNKDESHEILRNYCARLIDRKISCRGIALRGEAKEEIANKVSELGCNLLIVGARGMGAESNPLAIPNLIKNPVDRAAGTVAAIKRVFPNALAAVASFESLGSVSSFCANYCEVPVIVAKGGSLIPPGVVMSSEFEGGVVGV
ncbi:hypothetical protein HK096_011458, partial [Nowakowskiella sp. JEL0078]